MKIYTLSVNNGVEGWEVPFIAFKTEEEAKSYRRQVLIACDEWRRNYNMTNYPNFYTAWNSIEEKDMDDTWTLKEVEVMEFSEDLVASHMRDWYNIVNRVT